MQKIFIIYINHEQLFVCAVIRKFCIRIRHHSQSKLRWFHKKTVIVNASYNLVAIVDDIFPLIAR